MMRRAGLSAWAAAFLLLAAFSSHPAGAMSSPGSPDGRIAVHVWLVDAYDQFGRVRRNGDGTFYPGDAFKVSFQIDVSINTTFDGLEVGFDESVFSASGPTYSGSGEWAFEVRKTASPGLYSVRFTSHGTYTYSYFNETLNGTVTVEEPVSCEASLSVEVVAYEPSFTPLLSYPVFKEGGFTSFEKPFAVIVRYEGNGPEKRLDQRALLEGFTWDGYANETVYDESLGGFTDISEPLTSFASAGQPVIVRSNQSDKPLLFQGGDRYARLVFNVSDTAMNELLSQNYTCVFLNLTFYTYAFSPQPKPVLAANFTYEPEVFTQPVSVEAWRMDDGTPTIDADVHLKLVVAPAGNFTYGDLLMDWAQNQTTDEVALRIFQEDIYLMDAQVFEGFGSLEAELLRTGANLYNVTVAASGYGREVRVERVLLLPFREDEPFRIGVNMRGGGVAVEKVYDDGQYTCLRLNASREAGGLSQVTVYDAGGVLLKNESLQTIFSPLAQTLGFEGEHVLTIAKSRETGTRLTVKCENIWGASTLIAVEVMPYTTPSLLYTDELAYWLGVLVLAAMLAGLASVWFRRSKT